MSETEQNTPDPNQVFYDSLGKFAPDHKISDSEYLNPMYIDQEVRNQVARVSMRAEMMTGKKSQEEIDDFARKSIGRLNEVFDMALKDQNRKEEARNEIQKAISESAYFQKYADAEENKT